MASPSRSETPGGSGNSVEATTEGEVLAAIKDAGGGTRRRLAWQARWVLTRGALDIRRGSKRAEDGEGGAVSSPLGPPEGTEIHSAAMGGEESRRVDGMLCEAGATFQAPVGLEGLPLRLDGRDERVCALRGERDQVEGLAPQAGDKRSCQELTRSPWRRSRPGSPGPPERSSTRARRRGTPLCSAGRRG